MTDNVDIEKENVNLKKAEESLKKTKKSIEDLDRSVHSLPDVDEDGNSECPFAEELYAEKEKRQKKLQSQLKEFYKIIEAIDAEIGRCKKNLTVITAHQNKINSDKIRDQYTEEEAKLAGRITQLIKIKQEVRKAIKACKKAIAEASAKHYPGRKPREYPGLEGAEPLEGKVKTDDEVEDIFDLESQ